VDGTPVPALKGCSDVDLGCSPSTNTLPIRRLHLGIGAVHTIQAAWVHFPDPTVQKAAQTYARLDELTYRYASGQFEAELTVDEDGLVTAYAAWRRTGIATGPGDSEPPRHASIVRFGGASAGASGAPQRASRRAPACGRELASAPCRHGCARRPCSRRPLTGRPGRRLA